MNVQLLVVLILHPCEVKNLLTKWYSQIVIFELVGCTWSHNSCSTLNLGSQLTMAAQAAAHLSCPKPNSRSSAHNSWRNTVLSMASTGKTGQDDVVRTCALLSLFLFCSQACVSATCNKHVESLFHAKTTQTSNPRCRAALLAQEFVHSSMPGRKSIRRW